VPDPFSKITMERTTTLKFKTRSVDETVRFGESFGAAIRSGVCISLVGTLGAGKTTLAGAICRGLGVTETVLSPTFILFEEFEGRLPVVHIDLYRLEYESEIEELGVFDTIGRGRVILAEWGDRSELLLGLSEIVVEMYSPLPKPENGSERQLDIRCTAQAAGIFTGAEKW
jgi:tRNA threonylcarbamoyladenosine biosynthesis protein TsaE